jgi:hypothetical protein
MVVHLVAKAKVSIYMKSPTQNIKLYTRSATRGLNRSEGPFFAAVM